MIKITDNLWLSGAVNVGEVLTASIGGILNVAQDLNSVVCWPIVEYAHVGLIDGPGNETCDYYAAIMALKMLVRRCKKVLVYDHEGARALVVILMYLNLKEGQIRPSSTAWGHWPLWDERLKLVQERARVELPEPHSAHIEMFNKIPWGLIAVV